MTAIGCTEPTSMVVEAGILGFEMAKADKQFYGGDGIVVKGVENTIKKRGQTRQGRNERDRPRDHKNYAGRISYEKEHTGAPAPRKICKAS